MTENALVNELIVRAMRIALICLIAFISWLLLRYLIRVLTTNVQKLDQKHDSEFDFRAKTILRFVSSVGVIAIVVTALLTILGELQINIAPLIASVGVAGLALGLGAQTLVKDAIAGLFVLLEDQFHVGDSIKVGGISGTVEDINLRTTHLRDLNGTLHIVPNGEIRIVSNSSTGWSRARLEIVLPFGYDVQTVMEEIRSELEHVVLSHDIANAMLGPFSVTGPEELADWGVRVRILAKVEPGTQWALQREIRQHLLDLFKRQGIEMAKPRHEVVLISAETEHP